VFLTLLRVTAISNAGVNCNTRGKYSKIYTFFRKKKKKKSKNQKNHKKNHAQFSKNFTPRYNVHADVTYIAGCTL